MPDAVVVGAGHNGLVAANLLADEGWSVVVLEAASEPGGAVRTGELTVPGYRHDLFSAFYPLAAASPVMRALDLERYGLRWRRAPLVLGHPLPGGASVVISTDLEETAASLDRDHPGDGEAWRAMFRQWTEIREPFLDALFSPFPPLAPAARLARSLGRRNLGRFARSMLLPVRRLAEERFGGEGAALLLAGSALHTDLAPEGAASATFGWLLCCLAQDVGFPVPEGGAGRLTDALVARLRAHGGEVQCGRAVKQVIVRGGRAVGVRTAGGDEIDAGQAVIATVSATSLYLDLVEKAHLPARVLEDVGRFGWDSATVKVDWALSSSVPWESEELRRAGTIHVATGLDDLTQYSADLAMGRLPARPFLVVGQQAITDPTRAPAGADTAWAYTHVPQALRGDAAGALDVGGSDWVSGFVDRIEGRIDELAGGWRDRIVARHVFAPGDLEAEDSNLAGGAINGGTAQLHQQLVWRPIPGWGRAETPVANLYLGSASAHPGGGVHGAPGAHAARAALMGGRRVRAALLGGGGLAALRPGRVR
jgi:phytoene dehydrogenase-like protein